MDKKLSSKKVDLSPEIFRNSLQNIIDNSNEKESEIMIDDNVEESMLIKVPEEHDFKIIEF